MKTENRTSAVSSPTLTAACDVTQCGGCSLTDTPYTVQLTQKHRMLEKLLGKYGQVLPVLHAKEPFHYRNKVTRSYTMTKNENGRFLLTGGIYAADSRRVIPVPHCQIEDAGAQAILGSVEAFCRDLKIEAWNTRTRRGVLRHAQVRASSDGRYLLTLVTGSNFFPARAELVSRLRRAHPEIESIVHNVNGFDTGMILGDTARSGIPDRVLFGNGTVTDTLCGLSFRISPQSFYQVNHAGTELLYRTAVSFAGLQPGDTVLDAYCGIGTIGLSAAKTFSEENPSAAPLSLVGVELNRAAVSDAIANAKENHIRGARFYAGDAGKFLSDDRVHPDVLFMDPPRGGSDRAFLNAVLHAAPRTVVYISCGPETLARDLGVLTKGYRVERIQPVDMFPMTGHCETVCLLSKLNAKQHIEINLDMDELDLTDAEKKATYQEIKDYVLE
ncbi:MAG: 23S rRNA (uracil(1939)-C(5))-methyltransferase RlmD, partial [Clostridia bacterium]|nr:23S rRNA (uracil(1939)-C(5))-methyltransferase RlmD [Clostridia bacterium]